MRNRLFSGKSILCTGAIITVAHGCGVVSSPTGGDDDDNISLQSGTLSAMSMPRHFFTPQSLSGAAKVDLATSSTAPASAALTSAAPISHTGIVWEHRGFPFATARIAGCRDGSIYALNTDQSI